MKQAYALKQFFRTIIGWLWPLAIIAIVLATLTTNDRTIHTTWLGEAVFRQTQYGNADALNETIKEWATAIIVFLIGFIVIRIILGLIVSDARILRKQAFWLKTRKGTSALTISDTVYSQSSQQQAWYKRPNKGTGDEPYTAPLLYMQLLPASQKRVTIRFMDYLLFETWRLRHARVVEAVADYTVDLPNLVLISKTDSVSQSTLKMLLRDRKQFLRLEGNFSDTFDVYVARGYEVYALDVLNPAVMVQLEDACDGLSIEIHGSRVRAVRTGYTVTPEQLAAFETKADALFTALKPYLKREATKAAEPVHLTERFNPNIRPFVLWSDYLLIACATVFLTLVVLYLLTFFLPLHDISYKFAGYTYTKLHPWHDIMNTLFYLTIVAAAISVILGEIEVFIRRTILTLQHHNSRTKRQASLV